MQPVKVIAVTGGKGGVGKTNVSVNVSVALAKMGKSIMLLDGDLGLANVDILLGLKVENNLSHVVAGECLLKDIIIDGPAGVKIIPASSGTQPMVSLNTIEHAGLIQSFSELETDLDYLIIDTAAGIADAVVSFARAAQEIVVVVCDEPTSITDAYALIKLMSRDYGIKDFKVLANMIRNPADGKRLYSKLCNVTDTFLDVDIGLQYIGSIPFDEAVHNAVKQQKPVTLSYPGSPAGQAFKKIAEKMETWPVQQELSGQMQFFIERLVHQGVAEP